MSTTLIRKLTIIVIVALTLRLVTTLVLFFSTQGKGVFINEASYDQVGQSISTLWRRGERVEPAILGGTDSYSYWVGAIYYSLGHHPALPRLKNVFFGTALVLIAFAMARRIFDYRTGMLAAILTACFPSLILWSSVLLKDITLIFFVVLGGYLAVEIQKRWHWGRLFCLVGVLTLIFSLRDYIAFFLTLAILFSYVPRMVGALKGYSDRSRIFVCLGFIISFIIVFITMRDLFSAFNPRSLIWFNSYRKKLAIGNTAIVPEIDISTPEKTLSFLPTGLGYFYFAPLPWGKAEGLLQKLVIPEQILWYCLIPFVFYGMVRLFRRDGFAQAGILMVFYIACLSVTYGLFDGNLGTMYRHKAQVMPFFLILAGGGVTHLENKIKNQISKIKYIYQRFVGIKGRRGQ